MTMTVPVKRIFQNVWLQLFLGFIVGIIGVVVSFPLAILFYIKFAGFELFFGMGSSGDHSPITFVIAAFFGILSFTFPTLIWFLIKRFGSLKSAGKDLQVISLVLFMTLPLLTYVGYQVYSQQKYDISKDDYTETDVCIIKDGINKKITGEFTKEFECKDGSQDGLSRLYKNGVLISEATYLNGQLNGTETAYYEDGKVKSIKNYEGGNEEGIEVYYTIDGNTSLYLIHDKGKTHHVYSQGPETDPNIGMTLATQNYFCEHKGEPSFQNNSYTCLNNVINGERVWYDRDGTIIEKEYYTNGVLDGVYEEFKGGKLFRHIEFRNGKLDGKAQSYDAIDGKINYEGQYTKGLQNGIFRRYAYGGNLESEVVFEQGKLIKINILSSMSNP